MWLYKEADDDWQELARQYAAIPRNQFIDMVSTWPQGDYEEALRLRFRHDREWFLRFFWPELYALPYNQFHQWALNRPKLWWKHRAKQQDIAELWVTAAPRGNGKSTLMTRGECCHDTVYGIEGYTVILSADLQAGSEPLVKDICNMLVYNPLLHQFYGTAVESRHDRRRGIQIGGNPEVGFFARSFQVQTRGTNFHAQRPTKIIIDDGEHPKRVLNPDNRKADDQYLKEDLLKAGPPEGGLFVDWVGTILHRDALLPNLIRDRAWNKPPTPGGVWKAIWNWPTNTAMWDECHDIWADLTNPNGPADAKAFYKANRAAMDEGAVVMDPQTWPLWKLMLAIWSEGLAPFLKERQNEVSISQYAYFDTEKFRYFRVETDQQGRRFVRVQSKVHGEVRSYVDEMKMLGYLDPVPGKDLGSLGEGAGAGDYAAFAVLGKDTYGYVYVLDVWMKRARDSEQLAAVWQKCKEWRVKNVAIETNAFARLVTRDFRRSQKDRLAAGEYADVKFLDDTASQNKEDRIASLQPVAAEQGWLRFNADLPRGVIEQFQDFPNGAHDDAPDAIAGAYKKLGGSPRSVSFKAMGRAI